MTAAVQPSSARVGVVGTTVAHGALIVFAFLAARHTRAASSPVYEVNLIAAPPPAPTTNTAREPVAPPQPKPSPIKAKPVKPAPPAPSATTKPVAAPQVAKPPTAVPKPDEKPNNGTDVLTLRQEGISFPYPEYLKKIENAIFARWDNTGFRPGLDTKIAFTILTDGTVNLQGVEIAKSSGNRSFDQAGITAIESASNTHAFGPLPSGFVGALPVLFDFAQTAKGSP